MRHAATTMRDLPRLQQGSAVIMLVGIASVIALLFLVANIALISKTYTEQSAAHHAQYLDEAAQALESWYRREAGRVDHVNQSLILRLNEDQMFQAIGIERKFNARLTQSQRMISPDGRIQYHNFAIWIPVPDVDDTSAFNISGNFQPAFEQTQYRIVSGAKVQSEMLKATLDIMRASADLLEARFKAKTESDPMHDVSFNYFRAVHCTNPQPEEIPCTNTMPDTVEGWSYVGQPAMRLEALAGISPAMAKDAWGEDIKIINIDPYATEDTETRRPPYYATLRTYAPWGATLDINAVQAIN